MSSAAHGGSSPSAQLFIHSLVFSTCWSFLGVLSRLSLVSRAQFCRFWSVPGAGWCTLMASSRCRFRCPLRIRNALFGALGTCPRFRCLGLCPRVHLRCLRLRRRRRRCPWARPVAFSPSVSATVQGSRADVAGCGALADIVGLARGQKCSLQHSVYREIR